MTNKEGINPTVALYIRANKLILSQSTAEADRGMNGVRDMGTLDYVATYRRPREEQKKVNRVAWALHCIATMHPFYQANKRTAFAVAELYLLYDERRMLVVDPEEGKEFMLKVAMDKLSDAEIEGWLRHHSVEKPAGHQGLDEILARHKELFSLLSEC